MNYVTKAEQVGVVVGLYSEAACFESWSCQQIPDPDQIRLNTDWLSQNVQKAASA